MLAVAGCEQGLRCTFLIALCGEVLLGDLEELHGVCFQSHLLQEAKTLAFPYVVGRNGHMT